jgi:hypothetical protein
MTPLLAALGASIYISGAGLSECPKPIQEMANNHTISNNLPKFQAEVFRLPKHACVLSTETGAYIVNVYGVQRANEE